ncbi:hypothetical protein [Kitasatospora purpeofusca]|uniref:hypothetical protein n=1 Tax=Kitasatospora purpeofusca TaxID=67352 RepID=UPI0036D3BF6C
MPKTVRLLAVTALALTLATAAAPAFSAPQAAPAAVTLASAGRAGGPGIGWDAPGIGIIGWDTAPADGPGIGWD